ncbi:oleosin-B6 isoform X10 [Drosophila serrata]|uniref:oleosin-B6 isoform X10 n=1 Tax=Drosophila serrata TaxID=7274 RepID=UPI000A1D397F|nr:oleosin-B6 isoform X10 [Drosophila serrata]
MGATFMDRQGNVFSAEERPNNRYGDIFFIEPGSDEANRIRDQLEKDEKDLPSYDEVMRMCNLTTPTAAAAAGAPVTVPPLQSPLGDPAAPISIAALPAPPYSETDPHSPVAGAATVITMEPIEPSTSRAAQIPTSPASAAAPAAGYQRPETSIVLGANVTSV